LQKLVLNQILASYIALFLLRTFRLGTGDWGLGNQGISKVEGMIFSHAEAQRHREKEANRKVRRGGVSPPSIVLYQVQ